MIRKVSFYLAAALLLSFGSARAQQPQPQTKLDKQLERIDLSISADALFNSTVSGNVNPKGVAPVGDTFLTFNPSNTVGELASLRYVASPFKGIEFNFVNARYTENVCCTAISQGGNFGIQTGIREFSLGYVITSKQSFFGVHPLASVGFGTTEFRPTAHGGEGLPNQARATYYYTLGGQYDISPHFGLRVGFRQTIFLAPDFGANYLTILKYTVSSAPTAGFYLRF